MKCPVQAACNSNENCIAGPREASVRSAARSCLASGEGQRIQGYKVCAEEKISFLVPKLRGKMENKNTTAMTWSLWTQTMVLGQLHHSSLVMGT